MALTQKLEMRQGQSLIMTPQLQQAIKLLQMSNYELQEYVEAELEKNPLLEKLDQKDIEGERSLGLAEPKVQNDSPENGQNDSNGESQSELELTGEGDVGKSLENLDTDLGNIYADEILFNNTLCAVSQD